MPSHTYEPRQKFLGTQTVYSGNETSNINQFFNYLDSLESSNELCNKIINISKHRDDILNLVIKYIKKKKISKKQITDYDNLKINKQIMTKLLMKWENGKLNTILTPEEFETLLRSVLNSHKMILQERVYEEIPASHSPVDTRPPPLPARPPGRTVGKLNLLYGNPTSSLVGGQYEGELEHPQYVQTLVYKHLVQTTISNLLLDLQCLNTIKKFMEEIFGEDVVLKREYDRHPHPYMTLGPPLQGKKIGGKKRSQKKKKKNSKGKRRKSTRPKNKKKRN